jgi:acyl-coenzyme A thioesterase PaaI-like protein
MTPTDGRIAHHDLCFGCGLANPFGLQLELTETGGELRGRFFVKQDHQGAPGFAHAGVLASALAEAMSLAIGSDPPAHAAELELEVYRRAPVGAYVQVKAVGNGSEGGQQRARGELRDPEGGLIASATASFTAERP